jgi:hypothetical protein
MKPAPAKNGKEESPDGIVVIDNQNAPLGSHCN